MAEGEFAVFERQVAVKSFCANGYGGTGQDYMRKGSGSDVESGVCVGGSQYILELPARSIELVVDRTGTVEPSIMHQVGDGNQGCRFKTPLAAVTGRLAGKVGNPFAGCAAAQ